MATAAWEIDAPDHELKAKQADALWTLTRERQRRSVERMERAERMARDATTDDERDRQAHLAGIHREAAQCHERAAELFATHRDHERSFVTRMESRASVAAA